MKMIAKKSFRYGDRQLVAGDTFDTKTDRDATVLSAVRRADPVSDEEETASSAASPAPSADPKLAAGGNGRSGRGKYQRRDLRAQD